MSSENINTKLSDCCEGIKYPTPMVIENDPGLDTLLYRVGKHSSFKTSMLNGISSKEKLKNLATRIDSDPSIALLDSWAVVLDILSFYQEMIANEGFLRTANERRSVLELARFIGYELNPGVAASTFLAFTLDTLQGSPESANIYSGTKVQSIPGQDEKPQIFETVEDIEAFAEWNKLKIRTSQPWIPAMGDDTIYLKGTSLNLKIGDSILIVGDERVDDETNDNWDFRKIESIETFDKDNPEQSYTKIIIDRGLGSQSLHSEPAKRNPKAYVFRQRASLFGYNAPDWKIISNDIKINFGDDEKHSLENWPNFNIAYSFSVPKNLNSIYLDSLYPQIIKESWVVVSKHDDLELYEVVETSEESKTNFTLSAKTTKLKLKGEYLKNKFESENVLREIIVYGQSEEIEIAETIIETNVEGNSVILNNLISGLFENQILIISGEDADTGESVKEIVSIKEIGEEDSLTKIIFDSDFKYNYMRDSVAIYANVSRATHGETKTEILGSGDASKAFQKFILKQTPLTYVSASTPSGTETTLEIRVNDILWKEVASLYDRTAEDRVYITRIDDDGIVTVQFGDGINGSRLPTGVENIVATFRVGTGLDGLLNAEQLSLLMSPQLGIKSVFNPLAPSGADDPEELDAARDNAPLTVLTLDRIVSLQDYEDFARSFAGIGKAKVNLLWNGEHRIVYITIASASGDTIDEDSDLYINLTAAIEDARYQNHQVQIGSFIPLSFGLSAGVILDSNHIPEKVLNEITITLEERFSFDSRNLGQSVTPAEIIKIIQGVQGVIAVDLETLDDKDPFSSEHFRLTSMMAHWDGNKINAAELLTIDPERILIYEKTL